MKQIALPILVFISFFSLYACNSKQQRDNQPADSTAITSETASTETANVSITGHLADLGLTMDSDWRGLNLGDEFAKVKAVEKGEPFESDADHIGYTIEFKNLETADMLYYQTDKKISAIDVDLFLNGRQSVVDFQKELEPYFSARYGTPKPNQGGSHWVGPNGTSVTLKDVSKGKDFGLKIRISSAEGSTTASVK
ncbi:hypothetical protein GCM10028805_48820 [Spirosoma harenae]